LIIRLKKEHLLKKRPNEPLTLPTQPIEKKKGGKAKEKKSRANRAHYWSPGDRPNDND